MKRKISFIIALLTFAVYLASCSSHDIGRIDTDKEQNEELDVIESTDVVTANDGLDSDIDSDVDLDIDSDVDALDVAIKAAIIEQNSGKYLPGECYGVGHKIIEIIPDGEILSVYALIAYLEYRFEDDVFVSVSGTNPQVLMRFQKVGENSYDLIYYTRLDIFSGLSDEELEELLQPLVDTGKEYIYTDQDLQEIRAQADGYAAEYLKSIGRNADIGTRQEHNGHLLEELVLNEGLLKELFKDEEICLYPNWIGTTERIEDGERYIYQTAFDEEQQEIIYTKIEFKSEIVKNCIVVNIQDETIIR